ncbi:hypothetical protein BV898_09604 [Hypsibius exemplaris]|uniref:Uncharacterized protein n=1 Tax=Hypsibius exemplaris TaxID=2072580 RepID=A0A1W0WM49_HYPEX|nr:hypothetical protein BV898_09604 [Hypsibius exemplaris]
MGESQLPRLTSLLQLSKAHRQAWKGIERRSVTNTETFPASNTKQQTLATMTGGTILTIIGTLLLLIAFCSSHWLESRRHAYSEFVKLGLWEVCFDHYYHHSFQFHYAFTGCHWVYSPQYRLIWEFIMPPWFLAVQGLVTASLLLSITSLILLAVVYLQLQQKATSTIISAAVIQNTMIGTLLLVAIIVFGIKAQDQSWMPHQLYNFYGWSYWLTFTSIIFHFVAAWVSYRQNRKRMPAGVTSIAASRGP